MNQRYGLCIFCNGKGFSKEHVFSEWQTKFLAPNAASYYESHSSRHALGVARNKRRKQGDPSNQRIRKVCENCNNGWMSVLEREVKPFLSQMILGQASTLENAEQLILSRWIVVKVMVIEQFRKPPFAISPNERSWIKSNVEPPRGWHIWIDQHHGENWRRRWNHQQYTTLSEPSATLPSFINTQTTTLGIGQFFFHAFSSSNERTIRTYTDILGVSGGPEQLWPLRDRPIVWPRSRSVGDNDIRDLLNCMRLLSS